LFIDCTLDMIGRAVNNRLAHRTPKANRAVSDQPIMSADMARSEKSGMPAICSLAALKTKYLKQADRTRRENFEGNDKEISYSRALLISQYGKVLE